jgi:putative tryptophan/tyrosine transport system substrate-binding protein
MKRRDFLFVAAMLAPAIRHAMAQQPALKKRMAIVSTTTILRTDPNAIFYMDELKRLGYVEGENLIVERYSAEGRADRYEALAREVVETHPDIIATSGTPLTLKFKAATTTIPVVTMTGDPIRFGIVTNLARPGGNITGVSADAGIEIWGKRLELLSIAVANLKQVAFVSTQGGWNGPGGRAVRDAAQALGISLVSVLLTSPFNEAEYRRVFGSIQRDQFNGIILSDENEHYGQRFLLVELIQQLRLPAVFVLREQAEAGGLMSYSWDLRSALRRNAMQVAEILRGANPGDMPYFQESRFELVINLKTARELGLEIPDQFVAGAAAVIE